MELAALLEEARSASPERRIESRDRIAAFGARAIEGVRPWLPDGALSAFAVRVIERAGINGEPVLAAKVLRAARTKVPVGVADDVVWALQRLRAAAHPEPARVPTPVRAAPARRDEARAGAPGRRRPR
jgi:hypothetical protein